MKTALTALLLATPLIAPGALAHAAEGGLMEFREAPLVQAPFTLTLDPSAPFDATAWPPRGAHELGPGVTLWLAHNATHLMLALARPSSGGWTAFAWGGVGTGPVQVVTIQYAGPIVTDAYAANESIEMENKPDTDVGGTSNLATANVQIVQDRTIAVMAFPLESGDPKDPSLKVGDVHTLYVTYNETSTERPATLDEGKTMLMRMYLDRPTDDPDELHHIFAAAPSPWNAAAADALLALGTVGLAAGILRRPRE